MREIKFRAWHKIWKEMVRVSDIDFYHNNDYEEPSIGILDMQSQAAFSDIELMQYTGLKDKNNKEIYEGDIITWVDIPTKNSKYAAVEFYKGCFVINLQYTTHDIGRLIDPIVIGNIYQDSELIKYD